MISFHDLPSFWYSSIVFFSPTLKPSVCSGTRSSWTAASLDMIAVCLEWNRLYVGVKRGGPSKQAWVIILLNTESSGTAVKAAVQPSSAAGICVAASSLARSGRKKWGQRRGQGLPSRFGLREGILRNSMTSHELYLMRVSSFFSSFHAPVV